MAKRKEVINGLHNVFTLNTEGLYDISTFTYEQSVDENTVIFAIADSEDVGNFITINGEPKRINENDNFIITDGVVFSGNRGGNNGSDNINSSGGIGLVVEYIGGTNIDIIDNVIRAKGYYFDETKNSFTELKTENNNAASGFASHAEGEASHAEGEASHAEGHNSYAEGFASHAEGDSSHAEGNYSHAEGNYSHAEEECSHAEGSSTQARGIASHTEGYSSVTGGTAVSNELTVGTETTSGAYAHAEGNATIAKGVGSHSEGQKTIAVGNASHAEGYHTIAGGTYSHTEGYGSIVTSNYSHAEGDHTRATNVGEHAEGRYNISHLNTISSIGIGSSENTRCNALEVMQNGDVYVNGIGEYVGGTNGDPHTMENVLSLQAVISNIQEGVESIVEDQITYSGSNNIDINNSVISAKGYSYDAETETSTIPGTIKLLNNGYDSWIRMNFSDFTANGISFGIENSTIDITGTQITSDSNITTEGAINAAQGFYETSDIRKKNVIDELPLDKAYELISNCQSIIYTLKDSTDKQQIGLIAQEVKQYFPEVVSEDKDGYLSLDYAKLTSVIFRVLKDVIDRLNKLENK